MNRHTWIALGSGVLFGLGLAVSQMIDPAKVLAFLDVAGQWDPSLAFVMAGALLVMGIAWRIRTHGVQVDAHARKLAIPGHGIDRALVVGALVFGVGWGLVGYCPGPAIASLALFSVEALVFVAAMLTGMQVFHSWQRRRLGSPAPTD